MGVVIHDAIVVTSWHRQTVCDAAARARAIGLEVLGPSPRTPVNGVSTFLVCPDGGNEDMDASDVGDERRGQFLDYLCSVRYEDGSSPLDWVAVSYGELDPGGAEISAHAWEVEE